MWKLSSQPSYIRTCLVFLVIEVYRMLNILKNYKKIWTGSKKSSVILRETCTTFKTHSYTSLSLLHRTPTASPCSMATKYLSTQIHWMVFSPNITLMDIYIISNLFIITKDLCLGFWFLWKHRIKGSSVGVPNRYKEIMTALIRV